MKYEQSCAKLRQLIEKQKLLEARNLCLDLTRAYPHDNMIWTMYRHLGTLFYKAGSVNNAIAIYERLIDTNPVDADAHACLGICRLLIGDFKRGWPEYEWRLKTKSMAEPPSGRPRWHGESLKDKTILIEAEQGHGDTIQFVRYLPRVKALGATIVLGCQPGLRSLLINSFDVDQVVCQGDLAPRFDIETTLLSLPGIFQSETIPADVPYLRVPQGSGAQAIRAIAQYSNLFRVGLVWAGGIYTKDSHRSMKLEQFSVLFDIPKTKFVILQKGDATAELKAFSRDTIADISPYLGDFADTAAVVQELDLVISVDTSVAHLAGALGKPVWTMLPFAPDWRWMLNREDSPWYPTMRLFRQPKPGDWPSVIQRVAEELKALVETKK